MWAVASHTNSHHYAAQGPHGRAGLGRVGACDRRRPRARQLLRPPGSDGQVSIIGTLAGALGGVAIQLQSADSSPERAGQRRRTSCCRRSPPGCSTAPKARPEQVAAAIGADHRPEPRQHLVLLDLLARRRAGGDAHDPVPVRGRRAGAGPRRPGLLARAAFGYLPLSVLGVSLAAPLTMLLLAATDQMSAVVSASAATGGARFLDHAAAGRRGALRRPAARRSSRSSSACSR